MRSSSVKPDGCFQPGLSPVNLCTPVSELMSPQDGDVVVNSPLQKIFLTHRALFYQDTAVILGEKP